MKLRRVLAQGVGAGFALAAVVAPAMAGSNEPAEIPSGSTVISPDELICRQTSVGKYSIFDAQTGLKLRFPGIISNKNNGDFCTFTDPEEPSGRQLLIHMDGNGEDSPIKMPTNNAPRLVT